MQAPPITVETKHNEASRGELGALLFSQQIEAVVTREEAEDSAGAFVITLLEHRSVKLSGLSPLLVAPLLVEAQEIGGVIAEEERLDPNRSGFVLRHLYGYEAPQVLSLADR